MVQYSGNGADVQIVLNFLPNFGSDNMKSLKSLLLLLAFFILAGCGTVSKVFGPAPMPGETEQEVIAKRGVPAYRYRVGDQTLLEYPGGYYGQQTFMARIGPDGRLISYEQVRTVQRFGQIKLNESTKQDVLTIVGTPSEVTPLPRRQLEVWSYRYRENEVWHSIMHVMFDQAGIVRGMENARDPMYDTSDRRSSR